MNTVKQLLLICVALLLLAPSISPAQGRSNAALYASACASCHGADGKGGAQEDLAFETPVPDFSDCEFASREPDPDWYAIIHEGGPARAFDSLMPAFGDALTGDDIQEILAHVRTFCEDPRWPRGEFNLPRPLFTEKAFPEDEAVFTASGDENGSELELLYEKRFGPVGMMEIAVPLASIDSPAGSRETGVGDIALGYKHTVYSNLDSGNIFSLGGEVILPSGDENKGLGKGTTVLEPFATWGKLLPSDMFFQAHAFAEFPTESGFDDEIGLRLALGKTVTSGGQFGRAWSPMIEVLSVRDLTSGAKTKVDLVPQFQVALNTRQHILFNIGVRVPATETAGRDTQLVMYLLWDWFDGGFFDGW
jgi:mono/diheme cytochrome c family protein